MNNDDLITLNEEIAGMARAGLPLDQGLAALAHEMGRGRLRKVTASLAADLQAGHPLPQAIERQGNTLPPFYAGLIDAGIRAGRVSEVLATLTLYARSVANLRTIIADALWYPAVILVVAFLLFGGVIGFVLPVYDTMFRDMGMQLPLTTQVVLNAGREPVRFIALPAAALVAVVLVLYVWHRFTGSGRARWARWLYSIPIAGTLLRSARLASFTELLAIMVDYQVPLPRAFELAGAASSDPIMAAAVPAVVADLNQGMPLGKAIRKHELVPELVSWMTAVGEMRGALGKTLHQVAELYRSHVQMRVALLRSVLPPFLLIVTVGTFIGFFLLVLIAPMLRLLEGLGK